ncbi:MAG: amidohydrolase family protein [Polyangiales bacterium]
MSVPYTIITADSHAGANIATYREYLDEKHRALFDEWRGTYRNPQRKHVGSKKAKNWDDEIRLRDMDKEGVAAEVLFPNTVPPFFRTSALIAPNPKAEDYALRLEGMRAHNRWLVDFQNAHPERRAGIGMLYLNDIDEAIRDVAWIAKAGLKGGVLLPQVPPDDTGHILPLYAPEYDRFWAACQDHDVVVNQHGGTGSPDYGAYPISLPIRVQEVMFFSTRSYGHLLLGGVFHRFPNLRYIITEAGCAWVPERLSQLDRVWERVRAGALGEFQFDQDAVSPEPPSFYATRNCWYGASAASPHEIADRDVVGVDRICWGTDYPHYEGTYPHTRESLRYTFHDILESDTRLMLGENAARLYGFDLAALASIVSDIGPTPEQVATPLPAHEVPRDTMTMAFRS